MDIATYISEKINGVETILRVFVEGKDEGVRIVMVVIMKYGSRIVDVAQEMQTKVIDQVEGMTAFNVIGVDIDVRGIK